jgi:cathepsin B
MLEDRLCLYTNGLVNVRLSPEDLVTCNVLNGGCQGGMLTETMNYLTNEGIVSDECLPYESGIGQNGFCKYQCKDWTKDYTKYKCAAGTTVMPRTPDMIQLELMRNGPLQVGFTVYSDFMTYSSGIYEKTSSTIVGGHAVKLIGWDHDDNGRLYWVCQNQWGTTWGESGYFRIYAGQVGIDAIAYGCTPEINSD